MRLKEIEKRLAEIKEDIQKRGAELTPDEISAYETESNDLLAERKVIQETAEKRQKLLDDIGNSDIGNVVDDKGESELRKKANDDEKRGEDLLDKRTVLVSSEDIILPSHQSAKINDTFQQVSGIVDSVNTEHVKGGESFEQPYVIEYGEGDTTAEGEDAAEAEVEFGYSKINKTKITAYAEVSKEMTKLPKAKYAQVVKNGIKIGMKKKIASQILRGNGTENNFRGIFHNPESTKEQVIKPSTDIEISEIGNTTLKTIIFSYGGEEAVEDSGRCVLLLNKKDLLAFSLLTKNNGDELHKIKRNGNTGFIDDTPFILSSKCNALSDPNTSDDAYCMAYGYIKNYEAIVFSDTEIEESTDFKFRKGIICYRGEVYMGGNTVAHNGFIRVKKAKATLSALTVTSVEGTETGKTIVSVSPVAPLGLSYKYKTGATLSDPTFDQVLTSGWSVWDGVSEITATTGETIMVATIDGDNKCKAFGTATIAAKA